MQNLAQKYEMENRKQRLGETENRIRNAIYSYYDSRNTKESYWARENIWGEDDDLHKTLSLKTIFRSSQ